MEKEEGEVIVDENNKKHEYSEKISNSFQKRTSISNWGCRQADLYEDRIQVGEGTFGKVFKARYKLFNHLKFIHYFF